MLLLPRRKNNHNCPFATTTLSFWINGSFPSGSSAFNEFKQWIRICAPDDDDDGANNEMRNGQSQPITLNFAIKNWFVSSILWLLWLNTERPLCCSFGSIGRTWSGPAARDLRHTYFISSTIIVYSSYITSNLFIFECGSSVFHINHRFSTYFSLSSAFTLSPDSECGVFISRPFFNIVIVVVLCLRTIFASESAFSTYIPALERVRSFHFCFMIPTIDGYKILVYFADNFLHASARPDNAKPFVCCFSFLHKSPQVDKM